MGLIGAKAHIARLKYLTGPAMVREVGKALYAAGQIVENEAALSITNGAASGKGHVASKPGEPPNADTHVLDRSIETTQRGPMLVEVSANAPYASALEFGTSRMSERPYMRPARDKTKKEVIDLVTKAVARVVKRSGRR